MTHYMATWSVPGYLSDYEDGPAIFDTYEEAAGYLADVLETVAADYDTGHRYGDTFESMAAACAASGEEEGFAMDGPDGYSYSILFCEDDDEGD